MSTTIGVEVVLSVGEMSHAAITGCHRRIASLGWDTHDRVGTGLDPWGKDIEGAMAEMAAARALGIYWDPSTTRHDTDLDGHQVRWTRYPDGKLILRDRDSDEYRYVLVLGLAPRFVVAGWMEGVDAKADRYYTDPGSRGMPCWMIPQADLEPVRRNEPR